MSRIISKDRESINAEICKIATENYCSEYPDLSLPDCFRKTAQSYAQTLPGEDEADRYDAQFFCNRKDSGNARRLPLR